MYLTYIFKPQILPSIAIIFASDTLQNIRYILLAFLLLRNIL